MPQVVQTGASVAIDFLSGFGKGMVQNDINRRENEKLDIQKQKWQQEMTAYAAQDELRKIQMENSRLEIDMRKTQFADIKATKEQTKGFTAYMFDAIGKAKGNPADKQSALLEAYTGGAAEFPMADMKTGDKLIDMYSKIHTTSATKAWKIEDVKDYETGKKRRAIMGEHGEFIRYMPGGDIKDKTGKVIGQAIGEENLEIVNETIANGTDMHQKVFDQAMQAFMSGTRAVLGAEGQSLDLNSFMASLEGVDERTKSEVTMDWIFEVTTRLREDVEAETGTLDARLGRMLTPYVKNKKAREELVSSFAKKDHMAGIERIIEKTPLDERAEVFAAMATEFETLLPEYEMGAVTMELARLQNKTALAMRDRELEVTTTKDKEQASMAEQVEGANKIKEEELIAQYMEATGTTTPKRELLGFGRSIEKAHKGVRDWWDTFLTEQPKDLWGWAESEEKAKEEARTAMEYERATGVPAMETLKAMEMANK